jgi:hypothetical protein
MDTEAALASYLVVIYGTSASRNEAAWRLARTLPGKSAVVAVDRLLDGAIARPGEDAAAELDMVHTQLRLLVANYMKNGYNVVVEGAFWHERDGRMHRYEQDIDQLVALMRNMTRKALTAHLRGPEAEGFEYRERYGANAASFDAGIGVEEVAEAICAKLVAEEF